MARLFVAVGSYRKPLSVCSVGTAAAVLCRCSRDFDTAPALVNLLEVPSPTRGELADRCVARYDSEHKVQRFFCLDQFLVMAFAQLAFRERQALPPRIRGGIARNTLANANAVRSWRIYADFAQRLISLARQLYADEPLGVQIRESVYALHATNIDLCLSLFPWAPSQRTKAAIKLHTLLYLCGNMPTSLYTTSSNSFASSKAARSSSPVRAATASSGASTHSPSLAAVD